MPKPKNQKDDEVEDTDIEDKDDETDEDTEEDEDETPAIDYSKIKNIIDTTVQEKISPLSKSVQDLAQTNNEDEEVEDDDEDTVITTKEAMRLIKKSQKDIGKVMGEQIQSALSEHSLRTSQDEKVFRDFPWLDQKNPAYDKEFRDRTVSELQARKRGGRDEKDPYLLYDAASSVFASSSKWQKKRLEGDASEYQRRQNNQDGTLQFSPKTKSFGTATASQLALADKIGWSGDKFKEHLKKRQKQS